MSRTCPQCFRADDVTQRRGVDGEWTFTCGNSSGHDPRAPHVWAATNDAAGPGGDETRRSLDPLLSPLRACLQPGEPYVEYGIVEWRFRERAPGLFTELVREHGHTRLNVIPSTKTASAYLSQALGLLAADGEVTRVYGRATGTWSYNGQITFWALPPAPPSTSRLSWAEYATGRGLDPEDITAGPDTRSPSAGRGTSDGR